MTELTGAVVPVDEQARAAARARSDASVKPLGSLGRLEDVGQQLAAIARRCPPPVPEHPAVIVAAGDHGVHARKVTAWPQEITAAMIQVICAGGAAVNAVAGAVGADVSVLDVGVAGDLPDHPRLHRRRVRPGTADFTVEPAMAVHEAVQAVLAGADVAARHIAAGVDLLVTGDIGLANTTPSACLVAAMTGAAAEDVCGHGAGGDQAQLERKIAVVQQALDLHRPSPTTPLEVLAAVGGLEHAALVGLILGAAAQRVPVLLDGIIADAAALVAVALAPPAGGYLIAGHRSTEPGATVALHHLHLDPLLDLQIRVGEGAGGVAAVPLVAAAARALRDMTAISHIAP